MTSQRKKQPAAVPSRSGLPKRAIIGMIHLPPLPGSPRAVASLESIIRLAALEARVLADVGFHALIVENFGDAPFVAENAPPETIAAIAIIAHQIRDTVRLPLGINVLRNDADSALALAAVVGADFIRVNVLSGVYATDQGFITGRAHLLLRRRAALCPHVRIAADVHVKHAKPISQPDLALAAEETAYRAGADVLIVSGPSTGRAADAGDVRQVRRAVSDRPLWIGSGVTAETVRAYLDLADAVIVGTALKRDGITTAPLDSRRVKAFAKAALG